MSSIFKRKKDKPIVIVSGLPRSGTSMMMQMLEKGGLEIMTDKIRKADADNPKGYYEFEKVKDVEKDKSWLDKCSGKVLKMISMLLLHLPDDRKYEVIFMERKMDEILASQKKMLKRLDRDDNENDEKIRDGYIKHLSKVKNELKSRKNFKILYVNYNEIISNPVNTIKNIEDFLSFEINTENMIRTVDKSLYRQRK